MGISFCNQALPHLQVKALPDPFPSSPQYSYYRGRTNRYNDLSVLPQTANNYLFSLKLQNHHDLRVELPVLNELAHTAIHTNYKLKIKQHMLIDPFAKQYQNTLIPVRNQITGIDYTMKIVPFKGYNSLEFKQALEEVWIQKKKITRKDANYFVLLEDCFIYGLNPDRQIVVMLYEKLDCDLFWMGEYRREANWPWTLSEKLKIIYDLLESCQRLQELKLCHRDIRPSNLYYLRRRNRYVLGNFSSCRQLMCADDQLMTVCGVECLSYDKLGRLIKNKQNMGLDYFQEQLFNSLKNVIYFMQNLNFHKQKTQYEHSLLSSIITQMHEQKSLTFIMNLMKRQDQQLNFMSVQLSDDAQLWAVVRELLNQKYASLMDDYRFETYALLGYNRQFSQMAHEIIERNNIEKEPFKNAPILKMLGQFYEKNGTGGVQYLLNSCILFCRMTEQAINYRQYDSAEDALQQAEEIYIQLSLLSDFTLTLIQIKRLRALLKVWTAKDQNDCSAAINMINKTLSLAGEKNLPMEKQMRLFLTWGIIHRQSHQHKLAEERLRNGLSICLNLGAFESASSAALYRSHFLYELGVLHLSQIEEQHNPILPIAEQQYSRTNLVSEAEGEFQESRSIRQRQSEQAFQISQCHLALGKLYLTLSKYPAAKEETRKGLIKMEGLQDKVTPEILVEINYDLGSISYKLQDFDDAVVYYKKAIDIINKSINDMYWLYCIKGNLGLTLWRMGQVQEGRQLVNAAKEVISNEKQSTEHYDFLFLQAEEAKILRR